MNKEVTRIIIVDDDEPWRRFMRLALMIGRGLEVVAEARDGPEAVQKTQELQPDLLLLDMGLPTLSGIEVARQIRQCAVRTRVVFLTANYSRETVEEAFRVGADCYILKSDAASELLPAIRAALRGEKYVGALNHQHLPGIGNKSRGEICHQERPYSKPATPQSCRQHEVGFYSDERGLIDAITKFVFTSLSLGNSAIVIATESHKDDLLLGLRHCDLHVSATIEQGRLTLVNAESALSAMMVHGEVDATRFHVFFNNLIAKTAVAASGEPPRVALYAECVNLLWTQGKAKNVVQIEQFNNDLAKTYDVAILCGYQFPSFQGNMGSYIFHKVCAEHSDVHHW